MKNILKMLVVTALITIPIVPLKAATTPASLKGRILLQVESKGEAWYVNPKDGAKYYLANGNEAFRVMKNLGVGISNKDLDKIKTDASFRKKFIGKILLQVESHGEAYYISFDGRYNYLKDGAAAYAVMRKLGLGISNKNLERIKVSTDSKVIPGQDLSIIKGGQIKTLSIEEMLEISKSSLDHYSDLDFISLDIAKLEEASVVDYSESALISAAKYINPSAKASDSESAREVLIQAFSKFPHGQVSDKLNYRLKDYGYSILEYLVAPYIKSNKSISTSTAGFLVSISDGGFNMTKINNFYPFIQLGSNGNKCGNGMGFFNGLITGDSKFYIIGAGCVDLQESTKSNSMSYQKNSLVGYIWKSNIFLSSQK